VGLHAHAGSPPKRRIGNVEQLRNRTWSGRSEGARTEQLSKARCIELESFEHEIVRDNLAPLAVNIARAFRDVNPSVSLELRRTVRVDGFAQRTQASHLSLCVTGNARIASPMGPRERTGAPRRRQGKGRLRGA
jgi:hypothetical protein